MVNPRSECDLRMEAAQCFAPWAAGMGILLGNGYPGKIHRLRKAYPPGRSVLPPIQIYVKKRPMEYMLQSLGAAMMPNGGSSIISVSSA